MIQNMDVPVFCLSFNNHSRAERMQKRFDTVGLNRVTITPGVQDSNRANSTMLGHLDMIRRFCEMEDAEYGVFCEDDLYIHKDLKTHLPTLVHECKSQNIDILLMGYLFGQNTSWIVKPGYVDMPYLHKGAYCDYYGYYDELWGGQMYMLSKKKAREFIEKGPHDYARTPYAVDWVLTKMGNRAITVPMYAVEDGTSQYDDIGQKRLHHGTFLANIGDQYI
jgi:hypothetical protein